MFGEITDKPQDRGILFWIIPEAYPDTKGQGAYLGGGLLKQW